MNIVFLDVDGVLNSYAYFKSTEFKNKQATNACNDIDESTLPILKRIVEENNAHIVLTSTWRELEELLDIVSQTMYKYLTDMLAKYDLKIMSKTPILNFNRPLEIKMWLKEQENCEEINWISLDDDFAEEHYRAYGLEGHLVHTCFRGKDCTESGLQEKHVAIARELFEKQKKC